MINFIEDNWIWLTVVALIFIIWIYTLMRISKKSDNDKFEDERSPDFYRRNGIDRDNAA